MIVLNSLFPIFTLLLLGWYMKKRRLVDEVFLRTADKLIYQIFFPIMLFWKIGGASLGEGIDWAFCLACLCSIVTMFVISSLVIRYSSLTTHQAGSFSQATYRFNTYIGVAVILNSFGAEGVQYFGIVIGFAIPLINFFAVSVLIWYSGAAMPVGQRLRIASRALVANPLILGCLAGIVYAALVGDFPVYIDNSLGLISMVSLPLALISIGGTLTFKAVRANLLPSLGAAALKLCVLPLIACLFLGFFGVTGLPFKVGIVFFCLPASTAIYVLSAQLNSDTELASAAIVISTFLSFIPLSIALLI